MTSTADHLLAKCRVMAVVDWVALELRLDSPTQARHLRDRLPASWNLPYVAPASNEDQHSCRVFTVRVQDPDIGQLAAQVRTLGAVALVTGIEIALDVWSRNGNDPVDLVDVAYYLHKHHAHPPQGCPRITWPGHFCAASGQSEITDALRKGYSINTGQPDSDYRTRCYVKRSDTVNGHAYQALPPHEHRARIEITLTGDECPVSSLDELESFQFERLNQRFALVRPKEMEKPLARLLQERHTQLGRAKDPARKTQRRRKCRTTVRDTWANELIRQALRQLTERTRTQVKKAKKRGDFEVAKAALP